MLNLCSSRVHIPLFSYVKGKARAEDDTPQFLGSDDDEAKGNQEEEDTKDEREDENTVAES